jgi:ribosome recycling factor
MADPMESHTKEFEQVVEHLERELQTIRTGRAHPGLVELVPVEAYGGTMELKGVASITVPDAKTIQIEPWDKELVKAVEKALIQEDLGMQPAVAGTIIRLVMPPMTEENRARLVKQVHEKVEQARISLRNVRESVKNEIQKQEKAKEIGEDTARRMREALDKRVKDENARIEGLGEKKAKDIMTI